MKKFPKLSYAVLKGIEKYPKQCTEVWATEDSDTACIIGGVLLTYKLKLWMIPEHWEAAIQKFEEEWGLSIYDVNDDEIEKEWIYGMLIAIGE